MVILIVIVKSIVGIPGVTATRIKHGKESACQCTDPRAPGSIPESGRSPGKGNGNPLQSSCLGNLMDRGAWQATVHEVTKESDMTL